MVNNPDIHDTIAKIVEDVMGVDSAEVTGEKSFIDDLDVDSLSMVEITVQVEDAFAVRIPEDEVSRLRTVGDAVNYVASHR